MIAATMRVLNITPDAPNRPVMVIPTTQSVLKEPPL
jgi:hypothetical protein